MKITKFFSTIIFLLLSCLFCANATLAGNGLTIKVRGQKVDLPSIGANATGPSVSIPRAADPVIRKAHMENHPSNHGVVPVLSIELENQQLGGNAPPSELLITIDPHLLDLLKQVTVKTVTTSSGGLAIWLQEMYKFNPDDYPKVKSRFDLVRDYIIPLNEIEDLTIVLENRKTFTTTALNLQTGAPLSSSTHELQEVLQPTIKKKISDLESGNS